MPERKSNAANHADTGDREIIISRLIDAPREWGMESRHARARLNAETKLWLSLRAIH